ncbi:MAG: hypothetical protein UR68_C0020G0044, partial [Candidatus Roizmanbacteria bacterium GW2011_GWA2_35_19]
KRRKPTVSEEKEYFRLLGPLKVKIYQLFTIPAPSSRLPRVATRSHRFAKRFGREHCGQGTPTPFRAPTLPKPVPQRGVEPLPHYWDTVLNRARMPIPPLRLQALAGRSAIPTLRLIAPGMPFLACASKRHYGSK